MSSVKWRPFCLGLNVLAMPKIEVNNVSRGHTDLNEVLMLYEVP